MSKNTGTSELINYFDLGANGDVGIAGSLDVNTIANATTDTDRFLVSDTGIIKYRTGTQLLSDIGAQGLLTNPVTGTGTSGQVAYFTGTSAISSESNLFWDATNDRLGIGTDNPQSKLDINHSDDIGLNLKRTLNNNIGINFENTGVNKSTLYGASDNYALRYFYNLNEYLTIDNYGNVGIGTDSPSTLLQIVQNSVSDLTLLNVRNNTAAGSVGSNLNAAGNNLQFRTFSSSHATNPGRNEIINNSTNGYLAFGTGSGGVERMRITSAGNVGIGTDTPSAKLNVLYNGGNGIRIQNSSTTAGSQSFLQLRLFNGTGGGYFAVNSSGSPYHVYLGSSQANTDLIFEPSAAERMRITSDGNVLIGTTTDNGARLQVAGNVNVQNIIVQNSNIFKQEALAISIGASSSSNLDFQFNAALRSSVVYINYASNLDGGTNNPGNFQAASFVFNVFALSNGSCNVSGVTTLMNRNGGTISVSDLGSNRFRVTIPNINSSFTLLFSVNYQIITSGSGRDVNRI
jgi:hypothetical protein